MSSRAISVVAIAVVAGLARAEIPHPDDAPRAASPEVSATSFVLPDGFRMELVAAEPLIAAPSGIGWDEYGQMFVSELHGYNLAGQLDIEELNQTGKLDTQVRRVQADERHRKAAEAGTFGVLKRLFDDDGDGRMDRSEVWATNLPPAYGLVAARGGMIVACAPHILFFADRDGDGKAETRETLFTGFPTGELERGINAPQWGGDGWIYFGRGWGGGRITGDHLATPVMLPGSDFRIRPDGTAIEPVTGSTHTFGFAMTPAGDRFTVTTTVPGIFIAPLPWSYLARNPDASTPSLEAPTGDRRAYSLALPHPWRQKRADDPEYFKYYATRYGAAESEPTGWFTSVAGPLFYRDRVLPGLCGQYLVCEPSGNLVHRALVSWDGPAMSLGRAPGEERSEFGATRDPWSHPMHLLHGPDGRVWVVDYYREIIEDYSAIPRHLQQQYGLKAGFDRGRIYRLTHRDAPRTPGQGMSGLDRDALARELASPLLWRRHTAQRLLVERGERGAASEVRRVLAAAVGEGEVVVAALRTLDLLDEVRPADLLPFLGHAEIAVRVHALQLADRWLDREEGRRLREAVLERARVETSPRVLLQAALSLGETRDPRGFAELARLAREHSGIRWMSVAWLSSLHDRGLEMLAELMKRPEGSWPMLAPLSQSIAARRNEAELTAVLNLAAGAEAREQAAVLEGLVKGRKNAPRGALGSVAARGALAHLGASPISETAKAARELAATFAGAAADSEAAELTGAAPATVEVSEEAFRRFVAALRPGRDWERGHEVFRQACAVCHQVDGEGHVFGPDLMGEIGVAEETLVRHLLLPSERVRPGFETTRVDLVGGATLIGLLKEDGATSLTLASPGGVMQELLRKDVTAVRKLPSSLMPSFAETLTPVDLANVLGWLRGRKR